MRHLTNPAGEVVSSQGYTPFGVPLWSMGSATSSYGFTGEQWDAATNLLYLRARWYAPDDGVFLSKDPWPENVFRPQSLNGWSYVQGNPVNRIDPSGRCWGPLEFLRHVPYYDTTCGNLDMAIFIAGHPQASAYQKAQAVAYVEAVAVSHIVFAEALVMAGYGWLLEASVTGGEAYEKLDGCSKPPRMPPSYPPDPTQPPGPDWEWRGSGPPGSSQGAWFNRETGQSLRPDLDHPAPEGPHCDYNYRRSGSKGWRYYPDGRLEEKQ